MIIFLGDVTVAVVQAIKLNQLILNEVAENKLAEYMKDKLNIRNYETYYQLAKVFRFLDKVFLRYNEHCFTTVAQTDMFLKLDFKDVSKILSSSSISATSEIEVFQAADAWLGYDFDERSKFAKSILLKIRLPLLSHSGQVLEQSSSFKKNEHSLALINEILESEGNFFKDKSSVYFTNRYCGHDMFNILVCGGRDVKKENEASGIIKMKGSDGFNSAELASSMEEKRYLFSKAVHLRGDVFIFGGTRGTNDFSHDNDREIIEKYCPITNTSQIVTDVPSLDGRCLVTYCACAFLDKIYVIGGYVVMDGSVDYCFEFNTKDRTWKEKRSMSECRNYPACAVFQEQIVVSGGLQQADLDEYDVTGDNFHHGEGSKTLKTVEAYDPVRDSWSQFPDMINTRCRHQSVAVNNKLFVIGGGTEKCEVYDSACGKFVAIKPVSKLMTSMVIEPNVTVINDPAAALTVGNKIFVYGSISHNAFCYDVEKKIWCEKSCEAVENLQDFSCVRVPQL